MFAYHPSKKIHMITNFSEIWTEISMFHQFRTNCLKDNCQLSSSLYEIFCVWVSWINHRSIVNLLGIFCFKESPRVLAILDWILLDGLIDICGRVRIAISFSMCKKRTADLTLHQSIAEFTWFFRRSVNLSIDFNCLRINWFPGWLTNQSIKKQPNRKTTSPKPLQFL
jgi:hypothetical protein